MPDVNGSLWLRDEYRRESTSPTRPRDHSRQENTPGASKRTT